MSDKKEKIKEKLDEINERMDGLYDLKVIKSDGAYVIVDGNEELYYGGCNFDSVMDELNEMAVELFGKESYLECECPGRWIIAEE